MASPPLLGRGLLQGDGRTLCEADFEEIDRKEVRNFTLFVKTCDSAGAALLLCAVCRVPCRGGTGIALSCLTLQTRHVSRTRRSVSQTAAGLGWLEESIR